MNYFNLITSHNQQLLKQLCNALYSALYCIALHCNELYFNILYCNELYYNALHCNELYCNVLNCIKLYCNLLYCTELYYNVLHCNELYWNILCTVLNCTSIYWTVLYCNAIYRTVLYCNALHRCNQPGLLPWVMQYSLLQQWSGVQQFETFIRSPHSLIGIPSKSMLSADLASKHRLFS